MSTRRKLVSGIDFKFSFVLAILLVLGSIIIYSASYPSALSQYGDGAYYLKRHLIFLVLGIFFMLFLSMVKVEKIKKFTPVFFGMCIVLLVVVLFLGSSEGVAKRWLGIPGTPLSFQPSELMKLGVVLMLSWYYDKSKVKANNVLNEIIVPGLLLFTSCGLVLLEKHLSGTIIIALIGLSVVFCSGASIKRMILYYGTVFVAGATAFLLTNEYALKRISSFFDSNADVLSDKWQTTQGLFAIGSGGLFGLGIGNSRQKFSYVSEPQNDFVFTIWCEETGFVGAVILITLFLVLIVNGYRIANKSKNTYAFLTSFGITTQIGIQALLNIAVVTDLLPNTGISLPFFSYGGSSVVILLIEMGIILSISRENKEMNVK